MLLGNSRNKSLESEKLTPDFIPMVRIVFWNSMGFFFFWYLIPHVIWVLFGGTGTDLGFSFAGQTVGGLISAPIVGYLTDKVSKKLLVLIGSFGRGAAYSIMYIGIIFSSLIVFVIGLFTLGFFVGFFWSPLDALISQKSHKGFRSSAFGKQAGMLGWGNFVGSTIAFVIFASALIFVPENHFLVYSPLILFTISNVYAGIIFNRDVDENLMYEEPIAEIDGENKTNNELSVPLKASEESRDSKLSLVFLLGFFVLILAFMTSNINQTIAPPFFQVYIRDFINNNDIIVMLIYFPSQILSLLLAPRLGKMGDRINPIIGIAIFSALGSLVTWLFVNSTNEIMVTIILFLDSMFGWAGNLILQNVLSRISKTHRGKLFGASRWMSFFGAIIGPIVGGLAMDQIGFTSPFIISIFVELSVIPLYIIAIMLLKPYMAEKLD
ncbi:MAG: MFS transporter [Promethearchaeota archaeon]|nr:MAG: MFS transporter [Candidatus Lokiarchaeota archaeon]